MDSNGSENMVKITENHLIQSVTLLGISSSSDMTSVHDVQPVEESPRPSGYSARKPAASAKAPNVYFS